jgi:DNA-binding transcriptional MocR family regulator
MPLPEPWRADDFVTQSRRKGVAVTSPEVFAVGRGATPHCVRICLGAVSDRERLAKGLEILAELLAASPPPGRHGI